MKPDRSNYEIWLVDWLGKSLDDTREKEFLEFLEANPDLKEEAEIFASSSVRAVEVRYPDKEKLLRTASDLTESQLEYLSVAALEKDITPAQMSDLEINISQNPGSKNLFDFYQKSRLIPPDITFKNKNLLRKYTLNEKIRRYMSVGLSAAAVILVVILSYVLVPRYFRNMNNEAAAVKLKKLPVEPFIVKTMAFRAPDLTSTLNMRPAEAAFIAIRNDEMTLTGEKASFRNISDSASMPQVILLNNSDNMPLMASVDLGHPLLYNDLAATNTKYVAPAEDDGRSHIFKFIALNFRQKLLKDEKGSDEPLKPYEIAEAGIGGINKLMGWKMALVKTTDESGGLKSIYFSSKMLKFNAPVKKNEVPR